MDSRHRDHEIRAPDRPIRKRRVGLIVAGSLIAGLVARIQLASWVTTAEKPAPDATT